MTGQPYTFRPRTDGELTVLTRQLAHVVDGPLHPPEVTTETGHGVFAITVTPGIYAAWREVFDPSPEQPPPVPVAAAPADEEPAPRPRRRVAKKPTKPAEGGA